MDIKKRDEEALSVFYRVLSVFDDMELEYKKTSPLSLEVDFDFEGTRGKIFISVLKECYVLKLESNTFAICPESKRAELLRAVDLLNESLSAGVVKYNYTNGQMYFCLSNTYKGIIPSSNAIKQMFAFCVRNTAVFGAGLKALCEDKISFNDFKNQLENLEEKE